MNKEASERTIRKYGFFLLSILIFVGYVAFYNFVPFTEPWNTMALNMLTASSALFAAIMATLIFRNYEPDDRPRLVWKNLMIGSWLWFAAEIVWGVLALTNEEVPTPSLADLGWVCGFVYFTFAFYHQYLIIMPSKKSNIRNVAIGSWAVVLLLPLVVLYFMGSITLASYIDFYYPFADLAVGIAGISLVFVFQGGMFMRPWFGLFVFGISDLLYAWAEKTGVYAWSSANSNLLTLIIDSSYLAAYLILSLGFAGQWLLMAYGLRLSRNLQD